MRTLRPYAAVVIAAMLCACSQGGGTPGLNQGSSATNGLAQQKQLVLQQERTAAAAAWRAPKHPGYLPETIPSDARSVGISSMGLPGGANDFANRYDFVDANGRYETVLAGARKSDGAGVVIVVTRSRDLHTVTTHAYMVGLSKVRIEHVDPDGTLHLQTLNGSTRIPFRISP